MEECIFCKIVAGEVTCYKVWEDENFLAILDVNPKDIGHTLIIPKKHYRWVWDLENYCEYFEKAREVAMLLKDKLKAELVELRIVGTDVPHAHIHLVPHDATIDVSKEDLASIAKRLT